jgi:hypothetical protein
MLWGFFYIIMQGSSLMTQHTFGSPASNWADGSSRPRDKTAWVPAMIVGAVIFASGCGSGLVAGWFAGMASSFGDVLSDFEFEPAMIEIVHDAPQTMVLGETFVMTISVDDASGAQRTIQDIDWSGTLVDNMQLRPVDPLPHSDSPSESYREFVYSRSLDANGTEDFTFELIPRQAGVYYAEITVYVDDYNSEYSSITIEVLPAESSEPETP